MARAQALIAWEAVEGWVASEADAAKFGGEGADFGGADAIFGGGSVNLGGENANFEDEGVNFGGADAHRLPGKVKSNTKFNSINDTNTRANNKISSSKQEEREGGRRLVRMLREAVEEEEEERKGLREDVQGLAQVSSPYLPTPMLL